MCTRFSEPWSLDNGMMAARNRRATAAAVEWRLSFGSAGCSNLGMKRWGWLHSNIVKAEGLYT